MVEGHGGGDRHQQFKQEWRVQTHQRLSSSGTVGLPKGGQVRDCTCSLLLNLYLLLDPCLQFRLHNHA